MTKKSNDDAVEIDEVQRCRAVRRNLEREHGNLDRLFAWLKDLEARRGSREKHFPSQPHGGPNHRRLDELHGPIKTADQNGTGPYNESVMSLTAWLCFRRLGWSSSVAERVL
ncbi:MAG: hypothetical protein WD049_06790 [Candidatus Paceibacterota bacterium]